MLELVISLADPPEPPPAPIRVVRVLLRVVCQGGGGDAGRFVETSVLLPWLWRVRLVDLMVVVRKML